MFHLEFNAHTDLWVGCLMETYLSMATITVDQMLPFREIWRPEQYRGHCMSFIYIYIYNTVIYIYIYTFTLS